VVDTIGRTTRYDYSDHLMVRETSPAGRSIHWAYDEQRRCVRSWRDGNVQYRELRFDDLRRRVLAVIALGGATQNHLDGNANIVLEIDPIGASQSHTYDASGSLIASTNETATPPSVSLIDPATGNLIETRPNGRVVVRQFDAEDRVVLITDDAGNEWTATYDEEGRIIQESEPGGTWRYEYATDGHVAACVAPWGTALFHRLSEDRREEEFFDDLGPLDEFRYDDLGRVIQASNAINVRFGFLWDGASRLVEMRGPEGAVRRATYDSDDYMIEIVDEAGATRRFQYDIAGRLVRETLSDGATLDFGWDDEGNLVAVRNPSGRSAS